MAIAEVTLAEVVQRSEGRTPQPPLPLLREQGQGTQFSERLDLSASPKRREHVIAIARQQLACWKAEERTQQCSRFIWVHGYCMPEKTDLFYASPDARDGANGGPLKLGHFQSAVEHAANERRVLQDFGGRASQLQLLHHLRSSFQPSHHSSCTNPPALVNEHSCESRQYHAGDLIKRETLLRKDVPTLSTKNAGQIHDVQDLHCVFARYDDKSR